MPMYRNQTLKKLRNFELMLRSLLLMMLTFVFLVETIGIQIYRHACRQTGEVHISWFRHEKNHERESQEDLPACCKEKKKDCCETEFSFLALKSDVAKYRPVPLRLPWIALEPFCDYPKESYRISQSYPPAIAKFFPPPDRFQSCSRILFYRSLLI